MGQNVASIAVDKAMQAFLKVYFPSSHWIGLSPNAGVITLLSRLAGCGKTLFRQLPTPTNC